MRLIRAYRPDRTCKPAYAPLDQLMTTLQPDSIAAEAGTVSAARAADTVKTAPAAEPVLHPYEVLKKLPPDATPAQQDSAIQAAFHVENKHLSNRPDTLSLPGQEDWVSPRDVKLPQYYRETFFSKDSLFYTETGGGRYGVAGDPVPYTIRGDNTLTALLIGCFIIAMIAFANSRRFFVHEAKYFFREPNSNTTEMTETSAEVRYQAFFVLLTCLLLSVISFLYTLECVADTFVLSSQYQLLGIFFGIFAAYFIVKMLVYWFVNSVFFGRKKSVRWLKSLLFAASVEGAALFPLVLLQSYFDLSIQKAVIYVAFVIILSKVMLLYKSFVMFFRHKNFFLQIILYFCALEIMPLLSLGGILVKVVDYLKINF